MPSRLPLLLTLLTFLVSTVFAQRPRAHEQLYAEHCATCHGVDGGGGQGKSLVDDIWT